MLKLGKGKTNHKITLNGENLLEIKAPDLEFLQLEGDFSRLTMLGLYTPSLKIAPGGLCEARQLRVLKLKVGKNFKLDENFELAELPLRSLTLSGAGLNCLADDFFDGPMAEGLEELYLNDNQLTDLPLSLMDCTKLKRLNLSGNLLTKIPVAITRLETLLSIDLDNNPLSVEEKELAYKLWGVW